MGKLLTGMMVNEGSSIFYDPDFRHCLESHLHLLKEESNGNVLSVTDTEAYRYEFDLYGLLYAKQVPVYIHWVVMRVNNFTNPSDFTQDITSLIIPSQAACDKIRIMYQTNPK